MPIWDVSAVGTQHEIYRLYDITTVGTHSQIKTVDDVTTVGTASRIYTAEVPVTLTNRAAYQPNYSTVWNDIGYYSFWVPLGTSNSSRSFMYINLGASAILNTGGYNTPKVLGALSVEVSAPNGFQVYNWVTKRGISGSGAALTLGGYANNCIWGHIIAQAMIVDMLPLENVLERQLTANDFWSMVGGYFQGSKTIIVPI